MSSFGGTQAGRRALHQLHYQLHSVEGRAKCPTIPQRRELVTATRAARRDSKQVSKVIRFFKFLKKLKKWWS